MTEAIAKAAACRERVEQMKRKAECARVGELGGHIRCWPATASAWRIG
jgi:hypothetical protein